MMEYIGVCDEFIDTRNDECCWLLRGAGAPVHEELEEDDEDAGEHGEAEQDEAPAEHGEAVRLGLGQRGGLLPPGLRHRHPPVAATAEFKLEPINNVVDK